MLDTDTRQAAYAAILLWAVWLLAVLALALGKPVLHAVVGLGLMAAAITWQWRSFRAQDRRLAEALARPRAR
jgi:uncharacterized MnhB-related membrane protein